MEECEEVFLPPEQHQGMLEELNDILNNLIVEKKLLENKKNLNKKSGKYVGSAQVIDSLFLICISEKIDLLKKDVLEADDYVEDDIGAIMKQYLNLLGKNQILSNFSNLIDFFDYTFLETSYESNNKSDYIDQEYYISWKNGCYQMLRSMYFYIEYKLEQYRDEITKCQTDLYDIYYGDNEEQKTK